MTLASGGSLSGTPSNTGAFSFTVTATDNSTAACTGSQAYALTVRPNAQGDSLQRRGRQHRLIVDPTPPAETNADGVEISGTVLSNDSGPATLTAGRGAHRDDCRRRGHAGARRHVPLSAGGRLHRAGDTFPYTLTDGNSITNTATVTIRRQRHRLVRQQPAGAQR